MQGERLTEGVQRRIEGSDALIAFCTRRGDPDQSGVYGTHRWVQDELAYALAREVRAVEVREEGVDGQGGVAGDRQWIDYRESERDKLMVELAKTVGAWSRTTAVDLQLLPAEFVEQIRPLLRAPGFRCTYMLLVAGRDSGPHDAKIRPIKGGLFVQAPGVPAEALIQVTVEGNGQRWTSDYESLYSVGIRLSPE